MVGWWIGYGDCVIWPLKMVLSEDWKHAIIVPLYKDKGERNECKNYTDISLFRVVT